jgi:transposase InsO family protein
MPWKKTCAMDERMRFVSEVLAEEESVTALCADYGISRTTGYKWVWRYREQGPAGLVERSRAPHRHGLARPEEMAAAVLALKRRYKRYGPKKLRVLLAAAYPDWSVPAASTIGEWLQRAGQVRARVRGRHCPPYTQPFSAVREANDVWSVDFKGWFRTGDGARCDPLTVSDAYSRYALVCRAVAAPDHDHVRPRFEAAFCEFGLPGAIRSDNGPPFASPGAGGLSRLSVWWIKLGIKPERIEPGQPQQNGRHERLHGTLKDATARPPAPSLRAQQARFVRFQREYNEVRPHEALGQKTPASLYTASPRAYPCRLREPEYDGESAVRRVRSNGEIKWAGEKIFVSETLVGEPVAVTETESGDWRVCYADVELGYIDPRTRRLLRRPRQRRAAE